MMLNSRGHIDDALPAIIATALRGLKKPNHTQSARLVNSQTLVNAVLYNAPITLQIVAQEG